MNLLCQQGLSGTEDLDINRALNMIDQMAARVKAESQRHLYRFERNPGGVENSEGFLQMVMMGVVPTEISAAEEAAEGYLKSLSPAEGLAVFLSIRGMCLREAGRLAEAAESFTTASRLSPGTQSYQQLADVLGLKPGTGRRRAGGKSASIQRDASHSKL